MKELEEKHKEREQQWQQTHCYVEAVKAAATPDIGKSRTSEECPNITTKKTQIYHITRQFLKFKIRPSAN